MYVKNNGLGTLEFTLRPLTGFSGDARQIGTGKAKVADALLSEDVKLAVAARTIQQGPANASNELQRPLQNSKLLPAIIKGEEIFGSTAESFTGPNRDRGK